MSGRAQWLAFFVVAAGLVFGLVSLFQLRLARGDVFPAYSTFRADPLGTRAFYEALERLPGLAVLRDMKPLGRRTILEDETVILAGAQDAGGGGLGDDDLLALDAAALRGARVVIAFRASFEAGREREVSVEKNDAEEGEREDVIVVKPRVEARWERWGVEMRRRWLKPDEHGDEEVTVGALRSDAAPRALPGELSWRSDLHFAPEEEAGWRVIYALAGEPVLIERERGRGSIVLAADSFFLSNEALQREREPALLAWLVGEVGAVVFHERHLGVAPDPGLAALARRYGLAGAFFTALLLVLLVVWQQVALFVPPTESAETVAPGYEPTAGLVALLRRSVSAKTLFATCLAEWRRTARPGDVARVEAIAVGDEKRDVVAAYNAAAAALKRK